MVKQKSKVVLLLVVVLTVAVACRDIVSSDFSLLKITVNSLNLKWCVAKLVLQDYILLHFILKLFQWSEDCLTCFVAVTVLKSGTEITESVQKLVSIFTRVQLILVLHVNVASTGSFVFSPHIYAFPLMVVFTISYGNDTVS